MEFVVVERVRARFGSSPGPSRDSEDTAAWVGPSKTWSFDCPDVDPGAEALVMFQLLGNMASGDRLIINGVDIFGGVPAGGADSITVNDRIIKFGIWSAELLIIHPRVLKPAGNELTIEARNYEGGTSNTGNFVVDNIVVQYKTRSGPTLDPGAAG